MEPGPLLTSVKHYLANAWDRERAKKRGGGLLRLELEDAEAFFRQEPASGLTPEQAYERRWAEKLLQHVLAALGEEYQRAGKAALFDTLKRWPGPSTTGTSAASSTGI